MKRVCFSQIQLHFRTRASAEDLDPAGAEKLLCTVWESPLLLHIYNINVRFTTTSRTVLLLRETVAVNFLLVL
jgi:hypothetical protein